MGQLATLLGYFRRVRPKDVKVSEAKVDLSKNDITNAINIAPAGMDSFPLLTDQAFVTPDSGTGKKAAIGYLDTVNAPVAVEGETRMMGRDPDTKLVVVELHLKNDGEATILNAGLSLVCTLAGVFKVTNSAGGLIELRADGIIELNGVTINLSGDINTPTKITTPSAIVNSKEIAEHDHSQGNDSDGDAEVDTGPNN